MNMKFPWKRFWCPPEGQLRLDDNGFLSDPEGEYGKYLNPDVVSFESFRSMPCVVLLGEPGIGKSHALQDEIEQLKIKTADNEIVEFLDLKEYGSEDRLFRDLFKSANWKKLKEGNCSLLFFLDSLDEVRIRIPNVINVLQSGLRNAPIDRLFFRIACRTAEWPWSLKDEFVKLWNKKNVGVFELAPLRVQEVEAAANLEGLDAEEFVKAIEEKKAGSLACKPVTLQFLLNLYKKEKNFPEAQADLYEKGCLYLCEDPSLERREKGGVDCRYIGQFNSEQKLAVAARIAACLILSNRFAVYTDIAPSGLPDGCILIQQLTGGQEKVAAGNIDIDPSVA